MINSKTTFLLLCVLLLSCCEKNNPFPEGGEDTRRDYTSTTGVDTFGEENIFCRNVCLYRNVQMQGFDLSSDRKTVWYVQNWYQTLVWNKGFPDNKQGISYQNTEYMTLQYFGHATTFSVEEEGNERYLWLGAYGTPNDSEYHLYFNEKVLCRVKFVAGKTVNTAQADDYYYIGEYTNMHPAIDPENGLICINYQDNTGNNANRRCFVVYKFNEMKKAPLRDVTISCGDAFKTGNATSQNITSTVVKCHDLTTLTPVARFSFPKTKYGAGDNPVFYDWQGFEFWQTLIVSACGGCLGVLFTIPLRRAMVVHSDLAYPEGVAAAEILKVGSSSKAQQKGGSGIKEIFSGGALAGIVALCRTASRCSARSSRSGSPSAAA